MTNILIVDDSATIRRMVRASLASMSQPSFVEASSGLEAIERLALNDIHLVVLDLNMPDMHGLEVLAFVRGQQKFATLPVLVLTTRGDEASRRAAMTAGASAFMTKPFAASALMVRAQTLLGEPSTSERL
jgi:two-component system, chemotaxis family, chemotaxis protein CheY